MKLPRHQRAAGQCEYNGHIVAGEEHDQHLQCISFVPLQNSLQSSGKGLDNLVGEMGKIVVISEYLQIG